MNCGFAMSSPVGKRLLIGALAVLLSGCGGGSTDDPPTSPVHPFLGGTQSRSDYKRDLDRYQEYRLKLERDENEDFLDVLRAAGVQPTSDDVPDSRDESDFISVGRHVVGTIESLEDGEECTA